MEQFQPHQDIVVGLDIGTTKIACIVGQKNAHGKLEIIGYGKSESIGVTRGVVANIEHTVQSIRTAVEAAEKVGQRAKSKWSTSASQASTSRAFNIADR